MLKLASHPESIAEIEPLVREIATKYKVSEDKFPNILISLTEAVNNAIIHGNGENQSKFVNITTIVREQRLCVLVSDEGRGFDPNLVADPTNESHLECCGGRGVFLIKNLTDKVLFLDNGSTIEMQFDL